MLTKNDLSQIKTVVRDVIQPEIKTLRGEMRTLEVGIKGEMKALEKRLIEKIDEAQMEIITTVDKHKADKTVAESLEKRVERLEDNAGLPPYPAQ